jgi:hypothetical protein
MLGATMIMASTTSVTTSSMRYGEERARLNASSGITLARPRIEQDVLQAFLDAIYELNAGKDHIDMTMPQLAGITFNDLEYTFAPLPGHGNTAEDSALVTASVSLTGPPRQLSLAAQPTGGKGLHQDIYTFRVRLESEGHSVFDGREVARQEANVYVALLIEDGRVSSARPVIASNLPRTDRMLVPRKADPWDVVPSAYAAALYTIEYVESVRWPGTPDPPTGAWSGPPEVVSGPVAVGYDNGDKVYYWYLRGVPAGTAVNTPGAKLLAEDLWRFDTTYRRSDDTIQYQPQGGLPQRVKGTPEYAVLAVQAPRAYGASQQGGHDTLHDPQLVLPGGQIMPLSVVDRSWVPKFADLGSPDGGLYRVVSDPGDAAIGEGEGTFIVDTLVPPTNGSGWRLDTSDISIVDHGSYTIQVAGSTENNGLWGGPFGPPGQIELLGIVATRKRMRASFVTVPGGVEFSSGYTENSTHTIIEPNQPPPTSGGGGGPWYPPPPGDGPGAMAAVVMYVPLSSYYVPDAVHPRGPGSF